MDIINEYKNRFYNLLESTIGDVKPLITENTISGSPEFNQIVKNLGLDVEKMEENWFKLKNDNQLFGSSVGEVKIWDGNPISFRFINLDSKMARNTFKENIYGAVSIEEINNLTKIETLKKIVNIIIGGTDKSVFTKSMGQEEIKFYEFYENNNLEGYDAKVESLSFYLEGGNNIKRVELYMVFTNTNPENKVKYFTCYGGRIDVSYGGQPFTKDYVLDGNKISFEKDRKSTKTTGKYTNVYKPEPGIEEMDLINLADSDKYVKYGMRGDIVKHIQSTLLKSGQLTTTFQLAKDNEACKKDYKQCHGTFGKKTYAAVKDFQAANDLVDDGMVGPDTAEALQHIYINNL